MTDHPQKLVNEALTLQCRDHPTSERFKGRLPRNAKLLNTATDRPQSVDQSNRQNKYSLTDINTLNRAGCIAEWERVIGGEVPKYMSVSFIRKALAHEWQCKAYGGLPSSARGTLASVASGKSIEDAARPSIQPGTHLMREWNGRTYQVEVINDGFLLDGKKYRSLSAIAKKITGAHWSGPRFFGVGR